LRNVDKKVITFLAPPYEKGTSRGCQKGDVSPSVLGVKREPQPPSSPRKFWTCDRLKIAVYTISMHLEVAAL
jgi:hypothetical protein